MNTLFATMKLIKGYMILTVTREDRVAEFNKAAGMLPHVEGGSIGLEITMFSEELQEFNEALTEYIKSPTPENRANLIKEWADVQYTLSSFPWFFNFSGQAAFNRVADNNMTKLTNGKIILRDDGKVLKPEGYVKADMSGL